MDTSSTAASSHKIEQLQDFVRQHAPVLVLTGAGISTASGLASYRDDNGDWMRAQPITAQTFLGDQSARQRYWARSFVGYKAFSEAQPNTAHNALAELHRKGYLSGLVTQNVDSLHTKAAHPDVIDLHGTINAVRCTACSTVVPRSQYQEALLRTNPQLAELTGRDAPDGDSDIDEASARYDQLQPPACRQCAGIMKPDVVFFGENVARDTVERVFKLLTGSGALLVVGSSLMIYSGFRFARRAGETDRKLAIINRGITRADELADLKLTTECGATLRELAQSL